jgi:protein SOK2
MSLCPKHPKQRSEAKMGINRIPFERALEFANKEKITELLYPLFVHNIGALLYHPINRGFPRTQEQQPQSQSGDYRATGPNGEQLPPLYS